MVEAVCLRIGFLILARLIAGIGTNAFAAYQIVGQVTSLSFTLGDGVSTAATSLVGQSLGDLVPAGKLAIEARTLRSVKAVAPPTEDFKRLTRADPTVDGSKSGIVPLGQQIAVPAPRKPGRSNFAAWCSRGKGQPGIGQSIQASRISASAALRWWWLHSVRTIRPPRITT